MANTITIKFNDDGSIAEKDDIRLFKLSNGVTTIRALSHNNPERYNAYMNIELPNDEQLFSRRMEPDTPTNDGYYVHEYVIQSEELQYRGKITLSITYEEKVNE